MDNVDADFVDLDREIADMNPSGQSTWSFQTADCDPLSLSTRVKKLKALQASSSSSITTGSSSPSQTTVNTQPQGDCKAARYCYIPPETEWNLQPNTFYTRPDGLWGRVTFTEAKWGNVDIMFSPYISLMCITTTTNKNISTQVPSYPITVTRVGGYDANLVKNMSFLLYRGQTNYNNWFTYINGFFGLSYSGIGDECIISVLYDDTYKGSTTQKLTSYPSIQKGKNLYMAQNFCCAPMYYGYNSEYSSTYPTYPNPMTSTTEPLAIYGLFRYINYSSSSSLKVYRLAGAIGGFTTRSQTRYLSWAKEYTGGTSGDPIPVTLLENVPLGSRFSDVYYNIPEEWQQL